jgi:hypothetical protein
LIRTGREKGLKSMYRTFQSRIATKQDNIRRKLNDNLLTWVGLACDCIRIQTYTNREGDPLQHIVKEATIENIVFPPLRDVPIRDLIDKDGQYTLTSLVSSVVSPDQGEDKDYYIVSAPRNSKLSVNDLLFRVFLEPEARFPSVLPLEVSEKLGTIGGNSMISNSFKVAICTQELPQKIVDVIVAMAKRRGYIKF